MLLSETLAEIILSATWASLSPVKFISYYVGTQKLVCVWINRTTYDSWEASTYTILHHPYHETSAI